LVLDVPVFRLLISERLLSPEHSLKLFQLSPVLFDLEVDLLGLLNVTLFSLLLSMVDEHIDLLLQLVYLSNQLLLLILVKLKVASCIALASAGGIVTH